MVREIIDETSENISDVTIDRHNMRYEVFAKYGYMQRRTID